ncbi:serine/threonine-protein kinase PLK1-like [Amblyomma americanum]
MASGFLGSSTANVNRPVPKDVIDREANRKYLLGKFLGKGGFAKCYELVDEATNTMFAGKVITKDRLVKNYHKEMLAQEVRIHRSLTHKHIVGFKGYTEDEKNVYIIMELCTRRSLMEMLRRRKTLTETEARYILHQLLLACRYMVQKRVIHRDLKLANLLLNEDMELKVCDFGMATRIDHVGERKKNLCGTPNFMAPEILSNTGHSFEVDVWSIGCILYTLLVGSPPFATSSMEETCYRIQKNVFHMPSTLSSTASALIRRILQIEPERRPSIEDILEDDFLTYGPLPSLLPTSCLVTEPRFDSLNASLPVGGRRVVLERNEASGCTAASPGAAAVSAQPAVSPRPAPKGSQQEMHLKELERLLDRLCSKRPPERHFESPDETEDPASAPVFWISKWVDHTNKYGLAYELCDNSVGVLFNDDTRIMRLNNYVSVRYVDEEWLEHNHTLDEYPPSLHKKMTLLKHFCGYMKEKLLAAGKAVRPREGVSLVRLPCLGTWLRTRMAISFYLTNGTVQVNFLHDHTKIILCPLMAAVSYIDSDQAFHTYRLATLDRGCPPEIFSRLKYARSIVARLAGAPS